MSVSRIRVRWDAEMGCYRVDVPSWEGGVVVPVEIYDAEVRRLRKALSYYTDALTDMGYDDGAVARRALES